MADDLNERGSRDRRRINLDEEYEVRYWSDKWGITREHLVEAVRRAGPMSADVAKMLGKAA